MTNRAYAKLAMEMDFCVIFCDSTPCIQGRSEVGIGGGGGGGGVVPVNPPTFLEITYSENRVDHLENYGNNSITKF
jgi:hypothetical protein